MFSHGSLTSRVWGKLTNIGVLITVLGGVDGRINDGVEGLVEGHSAVVEADVLWGIEVAVRADDSFVAIAITL